MKPTWRHAGIIWALAITVWLAVLSVKLVKPSPAPPGPGPEPVPVVNKEIELPAEVKADVGEIAYIEAQTDGKVVRWHAYPGLQVRQVSDNAVVVAAKVKGRYKLLAWTCLKSGPTDAAQCLVVVGDSPDPPTPTPPTPPVPPQAFRAVLVYESGASMTKEQLGVLYSPKVAEYLDRKCADGKKGWRRWDKDVDVKYEPDLWKSLWSAARPQLGVLPAIVVVTGQKGEVFPLPTTEADALALLKKFGGE